MPDRTVRSPARCVALVLAIWRPAAIPWGLSQLIRGPFTAPSYSEGMRWRKVLGSGHEGGFGLRPGLNRLGLFCAFDSVESAAHWLTQSSEVARWQDRAQQLLKVLVEPTATRGSWSGHTLEATGDTQTGTAQLLASLTRASIRPIRARRFWSLSPAAESSLARAPGCLLAVGLGEAPLLRQATFSLWRDQPSMDAYARSGAHLEAIRQAYAQGFFSESMFTRFRVLGLAGHWPGIESGHPPDGIRIQ